MSRIIDLSMPITEHFRWQPALSFKGNLAAGDQYRITRINMSVHGFTHTDAQSHMMLDGPDMMAVPVERTVGDCAVVDLSDLQPNEAISAERLAARAQHIKQHDLVLLRSCWDTQRDSNTPAYWRDAPYMTREAASWLLDKNIRAIAYDFPQDYPIRLLLDGQSAPFEEHVTHDILLRNGVTMIEYLCNTAELKNERTYLVALPLKIPQADGAPTRVIAIEQF